MSKASQKKKAADKVVENPYKVRGNKAFQDKEYDVVRLGDDLCYCSLPCV